MRYKLRTLLIVLAIGPPFVSAWFYGDGPLEYISVTMIFSGIVMIAAGAWLWAASLSATSNT
jgi:hypothetical protein